VVTIEVGGEVLALLPEKAAFLPARQTLLAADVHIGKAVSFRQLGVPVPAGTTAETLSRLSALVERLDVRRVIFLGDFLHSARSHAPATLDAVRQWRRAHADLSLTLIRGNHDDRAGDPPDHLGIDVVDEPLALGAMWLCHHPRRRPGGYVLAGHLHPCIGISGRAFDHLRLPCFRFGPGLGVLPAFGAFTGMHPIRRGPDDRIFAVSDGAVCEEAPGRRAWARSA
jgi:DNA ligase-associated metallophosphoesterase